MKTFIFALLFVIIFALGGCSGLLNGNQPSAVVAAPNPTAALHDVVLRIPMPQGQCTSFSTSYNVYGGRAQNNFHVCSEQDAIFAYKVPSGEGLTFFVENTSSPGNPYHFSCAIQVDGAVIAKADGAGAGSIATCNAIVP